MDRIRRCDLVNRDRGLFPARDSRAAISLNDRKQTGLLKPSKNGHYISMSLLLTGFERAVYSVLHGLGYSRILNSTIARA